jgi:S1-C subfamily serine protease
VYGRPGRAAGILAGVDRLMTRLPGRFARLTAALLLAAAACGCISPEWRAVDPNAPILLYPAADALPRLAPGGLLKPAEQTVVDVPMTTRLVHGVARKARGAVVSIYAHTSSPYRLRIIPLPFAPGLQVHLPGIGLGSGFFIHRAGYVLTNDHVIRDADEIRARSADDEDLRLAVVARDPASDLALLKVLDRHDGFPALPMGDSEAVEPGDVAIAIGNPLGFGHTVTQGVISQTGRELQGVTGEGERAVRFIQTDTAMNPGSSGGPLITVAGAWVGVNTLSAVAAQGIGFAVPSSRAQDFLDRVAGGEGQRVDDR